MEWCLNSVVITWLYGIIVYRLRNAVSIAFHILTKDSWSCLIRISTIANTTSIVRWTNAWIRISQRVVVASLFWYLMTRIVIFKRRLRILKVHFATFNIVNIWGYSLWLWLLLNELLLLIELNELLLVLMILMELCLLMSKHRLRLMLRVLQGINRINSLCLHSTFYHLYVWRGNRADLSRLQVWYRCILTWEHLLMSHHVIYWTLIWLLFLPRLLPFSFSLVRIAWSSALWTLICQDVLLLR